MIRSNEVVWYTLDRGDVVANVEFTHLVRIAVICSDSMVTGVRLRLSHKLYLRWEPYPRHRIYLNLSFLVIHCKNADGLMDLPEFRCYK